ncbi:MAG: phosphoribosyltransferase [Gaiellaceae bacterium]
MKSSLPFNDRDEAGRRLAAELPELDRPLVLGLPRGGVAVGAAVTRVLGAPLDVFVVRKLGLPSQPELAMGAVASTGVRVLNEDVVRRAGIPASLLEDVTARERAAVELRERLYRGTRPPAEIRARDVVLVDDGLATGATMRVAVVAVRALAPARVVVAVPVAPAETVAALALEGLEIACVHASDDFVSVGSWYRDFEQVTDEEVVRLIS